MTLDRDDLIDYAKALGVIMENSLNHQVAEQIRGLAMTIEGNRRAIEDLAKRVAALEAELADAAAWADK